MITISEQHAKCMVRLLEDTLDVDQHAGCSDAYFRKRYVLLARNPEIREACDAVRKALEEAEQAQENPADETKPPAAIE